MNRPTQLTLALTLILGTTSLYATNGSNLIATGAEARAMGGTGIGISHGAESGLANVALITSVTATEVSFGGMFFMPDVSNTNSMNLGQLGDETGEGTSASDLNVIPEVSIAGKINDNFYMGIGIWGTAGMGVDYRGSKNTGQMEMVTNLQLMQFALPLAYKNDNFSVGITPVLQYGSLDINYNMSQNIQQAMAAGGMMAQGVTDQTIIDAEMAKVTSSKNVGAGMAQDLKFGYNLGLAYQVADFTIGATYKSQIDMFYKGVLTSAIGAMGVTTYKNDILSTPAEIGIGVSYVYAQNSFAFDIKQINWEDAKGYQDFNWENQTVYALGYEYKMKGMAFRLGYNYANSPISESKTTNSENLTAGLVNTFNTLGFPGIIESHYTVGGCFRINEQMSLATAIVYAPESEISYDNFLSSEQMAQTSTTIHSQTSVSFDLVYRF
ncbi:MAG: outer membrane protein transport protein [Campylobacterota bacterium]|nr:outer membrane protein transport protein [Campylobacterota bacterium]